MNILKLALAAAYALGALLTFSLAATRSRRLGVQSLGFALLCAVWWPAVAATVLERQHLSGDPE